MDYNDRRIKLGKSVPDALVTDMLVYFSYLFCLGHIGSCMSAKCFTKFEKSDKSYCACDSSMEYSSLFMFSSVEALMLCSMRCSQTSSCVAYNFFTASKQCQLFNQTLKIYSSVSGCQYYFNKENHDATFLQSNIFSITVDNELSEVYINGDSVPIALYFPNAKNWMKTDAYNITGYLYALAIKSYNAGGAGGMIAKTSDNYMQTNTSWKCTNMYYDGWYKMDYDDSFWPHAIAGICESDKNPSRSNYSTLPLKKAFMKCSMRCSQSTNCVAYNFLTDSNQCQLFGKISMKYSLVPKTLFNQSLLITVDFKLAEFFVNGNSVPVESNFPNANEWTQIDSYQLVGPTYILAIKSHNTAAVDNYILTNTSWKCTNNSYAGWYEVDYDDSFWPDAIIGSKDSYSPAVSSIMKPAHWIVDSTDHGAEFYCRKKLMFVCFAIFSLFI
ncbi:hypothetical protein HELRODRAFT_160752 [Helobdella robusta]|uniref:Apple domain-containing protein n=1 Tax=Helobdella robusta TaxID=6412 RepID=T1EQP1_HELRO|nr:hypothetical protein HELRODRAFT_160752 [Helobdella robusta]ESO06570.1 hypothetical protein HELRODRAFT_160752 [Helobdella robusta]